MAVTELTADNFETEVNQSDKPVLIDFWAEWCVPCQMLGPVVDEIAEEQSEQVKVAKVNIDEQPELAQQFEVMTIPTLMVMRDGNVENTAIGVRSKEDILEMIEA
ncbi:MAG: thioredoxin [Clostridiales bacterium]|nr:thioredoxin [Clostridiales bacterium]